MDCITITEISDKKAEQIGGSTVQAMLPSDFNRDKWLSKKGVSYQDRKVINRIWNSFGFTGDFICAMHLAFESNYNGNSSEIRSVSVCRTKQGKLTRIIVNGNIENVGIY